MRLKYKRTIRQALFNSAATVSANAFENHPEFFKWRCLTPYTLFRLFDMTVMELFRMGLGGGEAAAQTPHSSKNICHLDRRYEAERNIIRRGLPRSMKHGPESQTKLLLANN